MVDERVKAIADQLAKQIADRPTIWKIVGIVVPTAITVGGGLLGLFIAVLAWGSDRFDGGTQFALQD
jgi:hypothetical protein